MVLFRTYVFGMDQNFIMADVSNNELIG